MSKTDLQKALRKIMISYFKDKSIHNGKVNEYHYLEQILKTVEIYNAKEKRKKANAKKPKK